MIPFVGRERERAQLLASWERTRTGHVQQVLLTGEAGIGKTRLVEELVARARQDGARVLRGRCWDVGGAPAYWPWTQALGQLVEEEGGDSLLPLLLDIDPGVVRLMPRLRGQLPTPADHDEGGSEATQLRLFDGVVLLLRRLGADRPVLLVLDDLESADVPSLQLLRFLVRARSGGPLMVVGLYRSPLPPDVQVGVGAPLWSIAREPTVDVVTLAGLPQPDIGLLLQAITGAPAAPEVTSALHARTGGNPLFATEFIRLLVGAGDPAAVLRSARLPSGVRGIIDQRLASLPEDCRALLAVAAVVGQDPDLTIVARITGHSVQTVLDTLAPAMTSGVLAASDERQPLQVAFAHPLVRQSLNQDLSPAVRAQLHRRVGDALCELDPGTMDERLEVIASHYVAAVPVGAAPLALEYCRRAAARAASLAARDEAVRMLELALQVLPALQDGALGCDVLVELGDAQARAGQQEEARESLRRAAERAERLGLHEHLARAALGFGGRFVWARAARGSPEVALIEKALAALPPDEASLRARLLGRLSGLQRDRTAAAENAIRCRQAVELARRAQDNQALTQALAALALNELAVGTPDGLQSVADQLLEVARAAGNEEAKLQAHDLKMVARLDSADTVGAEQQLAVCLRLADRLAQPAQRWFVGVAQAGLTMMRGRVALAEELSGEARQLGQHTQVAESLFCHLIQLHAIRREQGRLPELAAALDEGVSLLPSFSMLRCLRTHLWAHTGRQHEARAFLDRQVDNGFADIQDSVHFRYMLAVCAELAARLHHPAAAQALAQQLAQVPHVMLVSPPNSSAGATLRYRGLMAAVLGQHKDAVRWLTEAAQQNRAAGAVLWALRAELDLARVHLDGPEPDQGARLRDRVLREAEETESVALLAEARALGDGAGVVDEVVVVRAPARVVLARSKDDEDGHSSARPGFRREGEFWTIGWNGASLRLRDAKGLRYLAQLLAQAGRELPSVQLVAGDGVASAPSLGGDLGPVLDAPARAAFAQRLEELEAELDQAESWHDPERVARAQRERAALARELAAAVGLGGRERRMGDPAERARQSVTKAIKSAIRRIAREDHELGRHLDTTVHTGLLCRYEPDPLHPPAWQVEL